MSASLKDIIDAKSREFETNFNNGDVAALVAGYYNDDPVVIGQGVAVFTGREGATTYFTGAVGAMKSVKLTTYTIQEGESSAIETGGVKLTPREEGADAVDMTYVLAWQKGAEGWAVHMDYFMPGVVR
ncbi:MAG: nuclear transport factor 2 family protein [Sulfitobacter sp.]|jgi:ketosteroid isomerase-like protein